MRYNILFVFLFCLKISYGSETYALERPISKSGSSFQIKNVKARFDFSQNWNTKTSPELIESVNSILSQPFNWLAQGYQTYAFLSADNKYVLKFFKTQKSKPFRFIEQNLSGTKLAFEELPAESGIIFVHINLTQNTLKHIQVFDKYNNEHILNTNEISFFIQEKAEYIFPTITKLMQTNSVQLAQNRIDQIFDLLNTVTKKNIADTDRILIENNNVGFLNDRAIYIDCGHLTKAPDLNANERILYEFKNRLPPLFIWLKEKYPELAAYYKKRKDEILFDLGNPKKYRLSKEISSCSDYNQDWEAHLTAEQINLANSLFENPIYWIGNGRQADVYSSHDNNYVLKFFKFTDERRKSLIYRNKLFFGTKFAYEHIPQETGIVFLHLNPSNDILKDVQIYDNTREKIYSTNQSSFIIQKKAALIHSTISDLMERDMIDEAKERLNQIFQLLVSVAEKKIVDSDKSLIKNDNLGFLADSAIYLDTGHLRYIDDLDVKERIKHEFQVRLYPLYKWLERSYPLLAKYFKEKTKEILCSWQPKLMSLN